MSDRRVGLSFIVDPSGNVRDLRRGTGPPSQPPSGEQPGGGSQRERSRPPSRRRKPQVYLIPIPIGLILFLIASLLRQAGDSKKSANVLDSDSARGMVTLGKRAFYRGEYDAAIGFFGEALSSEPEAGVVYNLRGLAHQAAGDSEQALADFGRALECGADQATVYNNRAITYLALGESDKALADLDRAIELRPSLGKAYYNRGLAHSALGDYDRAIADLTQAIQRSTVPLARPTSSTPHPGDEFSAYIEREMELMLSGADRPSVYYARGLAYLAQGKPEWAIADLSQAIDLGPGSPAAYYARALARIVQGDGAQARADLSRSAGLGIDPALQAQVEALLSLRAEVPPELLPALLRSVLGTGGRPPGGAGTPQPTAAEPVRTEEPLETIALYVPHPGETPSTTVRELDRVSCDDRPLYAWAAPGRTLFRVQSSGREDTFAAVERQARDDGPGQELCAMPWPNFGSSLAEPPGPGAGASMPAPNCGRDRSRPPGDVRVRVVGVEEIGTSLGTFDAVRVDAVQNYSWPSDHDYPQGTFTTSEWHVCGLGLVRSLTMQEGTYQGRELHTVSGLALVSYTPLATSEPHVRFVLADIQLGNLAGAYRAATVDEETAEALRRWDAGVRVRNIEEFERRAIDGHWRLVVAATGEPVVGSDIPLTCDPP